MKTNVIHPNCVNEAMHSPIVVTKPEVGMCATMFVGSDRYPMVVVEVINQRRIKVLNIEEDDLKNNLRKDNRGIQFVKNNVLVDRYKSYDKNVRLYTLRKNGRWMMVGKRLWDTCSIRLGFADYFLDPDF